MRALAAIADVITSILEKAGIGRPPPGSAIALPGYIRVVSLRPVATDPVVYLSEVDEDGYETRKIDIYPDGSVGYAGEGYGEFGGALLGKFRMRMRRPTREPQEKLFETSTITREEFEAEWAARLTKPLHQE